MMLNENFRVQRLLDVEYRFGGQPINSPLQARVTADRPLGVFVGHDRREEVAVEVCMQSIAETTTIPTVCYPLVMAELRQLGLYDRKVAPGPGGTRIDAIDGRPFSTDFSFSRFLVPALGIAGHSHDLAIFMDCDMLVTRSFKELLGYLDLSKAVSVVQHDHAVQDNSTKMDGQIQQAYQRKNWSSFMVFNLRHIALRALTPAYVNKARGSTLHQFDWLADDEIGWLPPEWNHLVGYTRPAVIHYTEGGPWFPDYQDVPWAREWLACRERLEQERD
jgi:hypothetical protein